MERGLILQYNVSDKAAEIDGHSFSHLESLLKRVQA
jgi:hypothetical protein